MHLSNWLCLVQLGQKPLTFIVRLICSKLIDPFACWFHPCLVALFGSFNSPFFVALFGDVRICSWVVAAPSVSSFQSPVVPCYPFFGGGEDKNGILIPTSLAEDLGR